MKLRHFLVGELVVVALILHAPGFAVQLSRAQTTDQPAPTDLSVPPSDQPPSDAAFSEPPAGEPTPSPNPAEPAAPSSPEQPASEQQPAEQTAPVQAPEGEISPPPAEGPAGEPPVVVSPTEVTTEQTNDQVQTAGPDQAVNATTLESASTNEAAPPSEQEQAIAEIQSAVDATPLLQPVQPENTDFIGPEALVQAAQEDQQLTDAATPEAKTDLLVEFADAKVDTVDTLQPTDAANMNFATERLDQQLDSLREEPDAQTKLGAVCDKLDATFRAVQLAVPEDVEQDLEITRGKCVGQ